MPLYPFLGRRPIESVAGFEPLVAGDFGQHIEEHRICRWIRPHLLEPKELGDVGGGSTLRGSTLQGGILNGSFNGNNSASGNDVTAVVTAPIQAPVVSGNDLSVGNIGALGTITGNSSETSSNTMPGNLTQGHGLGSIFGR